MVKDGCDQIAQERFRQQAVEKFDAEHDDNWQDGEIALAAACYALAASEYGEEHLSGVFYDLWPWEIDWWKPGRWEGDENGEPAPLAARIRMLEKAGALIAAEIDRLLRL